MNAEQKALLKEVVEWVEWQDTLEPGERAWVQDDWVTLRPETNHCGTAYCVAGYIGAKYAPEAFARDSVGYVNGESMHVSQFAEQMLGTSPAVMVDTPISDSRAENYFDGYHNKYVYDLFEASNTAEDIRALAEIMAGEPL